MTNDDKVKAALRASVMRFATGCTEAQADEVLRVICQGWSCDTDQLARLLPALAVPGQISENAALFWLHSTVVVLNNSGAGRKIVQEAAKMAALIDREQAAPSN